MRGNPSPPSTLPKSIRPRAAAPPRRRRSLAAIAAVAVMALAGGALAAANTFPGSNAGQGVDVVAGFEVTDVSYDADPTTQGNAADASVNGVDFTINRAGPNAAIPVTASNAEVFVQFRSNSQSSAWVQCQVGPAAGQVNCATTGDAGITVEGLENLSVVAYDI